MYTVYMRCLRGVLLFMCTSAVYSSDLLPLLRHHAPLLHMRLFENRTAFSVAPAR